jgi:hypothetical protein
MPAKSKQQQKFFGVVRAMQKGDIPKKGEAGEVADDMKKTDVKKMAKTKHKGLPKKVTKKEIKEMILQELQALNEVQPFVDNKLRNVWDYPLGNKEGLVYLATNDKRYPTEVVVYNMNRDVFHFIYSHDGTFTKGNYRSQTVPRKGFNSTHWVIPYFEEWEEDFDYERGFKENVNEAPTKLSQWSDDKKENKDGIRFDLVMSDEAYDELFDLIGRYVEDPDDVEKELDRYDDGGFDSMSNMVTANLDRDKDYEAWKKKYGIKEGITELRRVKRLDIKIGNKINIARAKSHFKKGEKIAAIDKRTGEIIPITGLNQFGGLPTNRYEYGYIVEAKMTPAKVQKAQRDLVKIIDALKKNFPHYKAAKESGDTKKLAKFRDLAIKLTKKKKDLEIALDKALGGLYQDAELELNEALPKFKTPLEALKWVWGKRDEAMDMEQQLKDISAEIQQLYSEMEQEAEPGGGPIADKFGRELEALENQHKDLRAEYDQLMAEIDEYDQNYM